MTTYEQELMRFMLVSGPLSIRWSEMAGKFYVEDALASDPLIGQFDTWDEAMHFVWGEPILQAACKGISLNMAMVVRRNPYTLMPNRWSKHETQVL